MALLGIRVLGDPILREQTRPVSSVTDNICQLVDDMFETMYAAEGIGLAAPQVGRHERVTVINADGTPYTLINPEITVREGSGRAEEGCLSIPEIFGEVERSAYVVVHALDRNANLFELAAEGLLARCIQHEIDHLDGKLFIDYLSLIKRRIAARKWEREVDQYPGFIRTVVPGQSIGRKSRSRAEHNDMSDEADGVEHHTSERIIKAEHEPEL